MLNLQPRNAPQAAISLISPPPNAPGMMKVMINIGKLTDNTPNAVCARVISEKNGADRILVITSKMIRRLGIFIVVMSMNAMIPSNVRKIHINNICQNISLYAVDSVLDFFRPLLKIIRLSSKKF